jgi:flagellin
MSLYINTNITSMNAQRLLSINTAAVQNNMSQLASGYRINNASDDAAGLQIADNLTSQINGSNQAISNAQAGSNLLAVADGAYSVVEDNLQRIRELAVEAANDTNGSTQRSAIKTEIDARIADINRITKATQYNGKNLLQSAQSSLRIEVGANTKASLDTINIGSALGSATATTLGIKASTNEVASNSNARAFIATVDSAITAVGNRRASIGAFENRLTSSISSLQISAQNLTASESQIMDVDVASATASLAQNQILQQSAVSILAQANQAPSLALKLIGA